MKAQAPFRIPVSFPISAYLDCNGNPQSSECLLRSSLSGSHPTVMENWQWEEGKGIILGCADGSLYVLHCSIVVSPNVSDSQPQEVKDHRTTKSAKGRRNSSFTSPTFGSTLSPTLNVTPKPRVVSGITTEQVEAPKNYVDFEDEPDKLKDILKGRTPRDKHVLDSNSSKSNAPSIIETGSTLKSRNALPKSFRSAANSRASTPPPFSTPSSAGGCSADNGWRLKYHIIPAHSGFGHAVGSVQLLSDERHAAVLQESGHLNIYTLEDGFCKFTLHVGAHVLDHVDKHERMPTSEVWRWRHLTVSSMGELLVLVASADVGESPLVGDPQEGSSEKSKCVLIELLSIASDFQLKKLDHWELDGPASANTLHVEADGSLSFFYVSHDGRLVVRGVNLTSYAFANETCSSVNNEKTGTDIISGTPPTLFERRDLGVLIPDTTPNGMTIREQEDGQLQGIVWFREEITMFEYVNHSMACVFRCPASNVKNANWLDKETFALYHEDRIELYGTKLANPDNDDVQDHSSPSSTSRIQPELICSLNIGYYEAISLTRNSLIISRLSDTDRQRELMSYPILDKKLRQELSHSLWQSKTLETTASSPTTIGSMLSLDFNTFVLGYSDGRLRQFSLPQLGCNRENSYLKTSSSKKTSTSFLRASILGLHVVQNPRTREKFIAGGGDDGSIAFWSLNTFELAARWGIFTAPLSKVVQLEVEKNAPLHGCALCVSRDGTIAVIVVDGFQFLYLVPGSAAPLTRVCLRGKDLLLIYADHRARLWDSQTKELWRSMRQDKEMINQGGWITSDLEEENTCIPKTLWCSIADSYDGLDAAASLSLDLERLIVDSVSVTRTISTSKDEIREILKALDRLKLVLSILLTPGLSEDIDAICYGKLGAYPSSATLGMSSAGTNTLYALYYPCEMWCISETMTAMRALAIIAVLRAMSLFEELAEAANTVIAFYAVALGACVGPDYKRPSLKYLGTHWFRASNELRPAVRTLFDATIKGLSDQEAIEIFEKWQHLVPTLQPDAEKESLTAALALLICGSVASEKYSMLSVNALMDISKSTSLYLHDENSIYRVLAIDLCSRGFHVWQHYIDAVEILRSLFNIATNSRKDSISVQNMGAQARLAVLSIASDNMPFLMNTLCLDILSPPTMEHRRSVLQVLAFLIKKRPLVLQPHLPRLMEAVVKSLDPNSTANRELVLDAATEIISYVVKTYPTVCFHMASQRLAVGTSEGAVVMYDVKTAIRLYILENHKKSITACSFSPDGRRLVSVCLKESNVLVWKVGSSFSSFFNPGAPPRQGHGGTSQPFKTLSFNIGEDVEMTTAETLDFVAVEWIADRSVKVKIRQSVLTFST